MPFCDCEQLRDLGWSERAELTGLERSEFERADADAAQLLDQQSEMLEHGTDLLVAAFDQADFVPGVFAATNQAKSGGRGAA